MNVIQFKRKVEMKKDLEIIERGDTPYLLIRGAISKGVMHSTEIDKDMLKAIRNQVKKKFSSKGVKCDTL